MSAGGAEEVVAAKGIGMGLSPGQSLLVPAGFLIALVGAIVALCVVATGALVVPARPELAARVNLALVAAGYALPVLMLFATLIVRRSPRLGAAAVLVADAGLVFVFALQAWSIVLGIVHVAGAAIAAVGAQRTSRERARRES